MLRYFYDNKPILNFTLFDWIVYAKYNLTNMPLHPFEQKINMLPSQCFILYSTQMRWQAINTITY